MIDPMRRWAHVHEKPDYAGLATFCGAPYTEDPAELAGFARLPRCAYLLKLSVTALLTTGDGFPDAVVDYIAFCKG